eukprot:scaffold4283_cov84-Skeletonema_dohrnii-CCMP3373.AAC.1
MANYNGPLQAVDCRTRSVRYDMVQSSASGHPRLGLIRTPTMMYNSDADATNKYLSREKDASILSWPTTMGHYKLWIVVLEALDTIWCRVVLAASGHPKLGLTISPTMM